MNGFARALTRGVAALDCKSRARRTNMQQERQRVSTRSLQLVPVDEHAGRKAPDAGRDSRLLARIRRKLPVAIMVALPTLIGAIYFFLIAADRYEAEAKFVVRSPSSNATSQLASLMQGSTITRSMDDAYIVQAYLSSRDLARRLVVTAGLLERLGRPEADFLWRYPGPFSKHNEERLHRYMKSIVDIENDYSTGITTLRVQAFRPDDARALTEAMLTESEMLINRLSQRAISDAIASAEREVERTRLLAREAHGRITEFRNRIGMIDPGRVSTTALETISRLALDMAQSSAQLAEVEKASPQSTQISSLRHRVSALDAQIVKEQQRLAGAGDSLAPLIAEYERLTLEREFAERAFASSLTSLESAQLDAQRQRLFLERVASPVQPDYARYPRRFLGLAAVFAFFWIIFSILQHLVFNAISHAQK